jgi:transcriptional regulator with XRE-family HTH domain
MDNERGSFGRIVRARRKQLNMSQEDLAARIGKERSYLSQLETGRIRLPEAELRRTIAEALGYTDGDLLRLAGYGRTPEDTATPEEVALMISGELVPVEEPPQDPRARLAELLPLLDERQAKYFVVHLEFVLGLRD